jgi:integrative and conjugative element protein (TIGR02256 family)
LVTLDASLAKEVIAESVRHAPVETGGVMLGRRTGRGRRIAITQLVDAGPGALRERHRFQPDGRWQKDEIARRYNDSGRTLEYLGDWHSHPAGGGPSALDSATASLIARTPNARCPKPVFLIVTRVNDGWKLCAYRWTTRRFVRIPVRVPDGERAAGCGLRKRSVGCVADDDYVSAAPGAGFEPGD